MLIIELIFYFGSAFNSMPRDGNYSLNCIAVCKDNDGEIIKN